MNFNYCFSLNKKKSLESLINSSKNKYFIKIVKVDIMTNMNVKVKFFVWNFNKLSILFYGKDQIRMEKYFVPYLCLVFSAIC